MHILIAYLIYLISCMYTQGHVFQNSIIQQTNIIIKFVYIKE